MNLKSKSKKKQRNTDCKSSSKSTICICPRCRIKHYKDVFWTGRGIPRIYCEECKTYFRNVDVNTEGLHSLPREIKDKFSIK